jgi:hypothetical protein
MELPPGTEIDHPALRGSHFRCCPSCLQRHPDWQESLLSSLGLDSVELQRAQGQ